VIWTAADIPDLGGRVAVVTGASGGLGAETASALAARGAHVVMAVRDQGKAAATVARIRRQTPQPSLQLVDLDLAALSSVRSAADAILATNDRIDILVNNAGVMATPESRTADGFELQLGTNHLGHWALTAQLMPGILAAERARVVSVTSTAHHMGRPLNPRNPHLHGSYSPWKAYGQSKLANYHFALGLQREFERAGVAAQSLMAHPGLSHTELQVVTERAGGVGVSGPLWRWLAARTGMTPADGALPQLRAATDPAARGGELYGPRFGNFGPPVRLPLLRRGTDGAIAIVWQVSDRETGVPMRIAR